MRNSTLASSKPLAEQLEGRTLFAAVPTVVAVGGFLDVKGTGKADVIVVSVNASDSSKVDVVLNGAAPQQFDMLSVLAGVRVFGKGGDDNISVAGLSLVCQLDGGGGHDTLTGGVNSDLLVGRGGRDTIFGGAGADNINGGGGIDVVDGGDGNDIVNGGGGRDLLTGGLGADHFLGRDKEFELVDMSSDDTHTDLSIVDKAFDLVDDILDIFPF